MAEEIDMRKWSQLPLVRKPGADGSQPTGASDYWFWEGHVLEHIPQAALDAARASIALAVETNDVDGEMADPIADSIVASLVESGHIPLGYFGY